MNSPELQSIVLEVLKGAVLAFAGWLLKMHSDVKTLKNEVNTAFKKIRDLESARKPSERP